VGGRPVNMQNRSPPTTENIIHMLNKHYTGVDTTTCTLA